MKELFASRKTFRTALETFVEVSFGIKDPTDRDDFVRMLYLIRDGSDKVVDEVLACAQLEPPHNDDDRDEVDKRVTLVGRMYEKALEAKDVTPDTDHKPVGPTNPLSYSETHAIEDSMANMHLAPANAPPTASPPPTVADSQPEPAPAMQPPSLLGRPPPAASAPAVMMMAHQQHQPPLPPPPQQQQFPPLLPFLTQVQQPQPYSVPLFPATRKSLSVTAFVDFLRTVSFGIVFEFAAALYSSSPAALRDADGDIRKYLFHISRHTAVISGVAKVPVDGVSAGIFLFRIGAHSESVPETRFRTLVREYITFLEHIEICKPDGYVVRFTDRNVVLAKVEAVDFPGGMTFPIMHEARDFAKDAAGQRPRTYDGKDSTYMSDDLVRPAPTINVRELHRRQLCVACRHFLRGMCYRGDSCNFCHDKEHQVQLEQATSDLRTVLPKTAAGAARLPRNQKTETS